MTDAEIREALIGVGVTDSQLLTVISSFIRHYGDARERKGERSAYGSASTWATEYPEADKVWQEMLVQALKESQ